MEDELITYKTAKLAKEKEFKNGGKGICIYKTTQNNPETNKPEGSFGWKEGEEEGVNFMVNGENKYGDYSNEIYDMFETPTQSLLQRWLREVHNLHIDVRFNDISEGKYFIYIMMCKFPFHTLYKTDEYYDTYEQALEQGLQEALKLI